jgi:hypothetical protein
MVFPDLDSREIVKPTKTRSMKKLFRLSCIMLAGIVSCSLSGNAQARDYFLTLTVIPDSNLQVSFYLEANPGQIEWGDGSIERLATTHTVKGVHSHTYTSDTEQTIEIHSDSIALFKIRVGLRTLNCGAARLTSLDVEGCTRLWYVNCATNRLSASALNSMFESLPDPFTGFAKGGDCYPRQSRRAFR